MSLWPTSALPPPSSRPCNIYLCTTAISPHSLRPPSPATLNKNHPKHALPGQSLLPTFTSYAKLHSHSAGLPDDSTGQKRPLSGSDVLWALERATAQKSKKRIKDVSFTSGDPNTGPDKAPADCTNVRPLSIKTEWSIRLKRLEQRLQQLMDA